MDFEEKAYLVSNLDFEERPTLLVTWKAYLISSLDFEERSTLLVTWKAYLVSNLESLPY